jgi:hypothetical protein
MPSRDDDLTLPSDDELRKTFAQLAEPVELSENERDEVEEIIRKTRERFEQGEADAAGRKRSRPIPTAE